MDLSLLAVAARLVVGLMFVVIGLRLLLGRFAQEAVSAKLKDDLAEIERWEALALSADKPEAAGRPWP